MASRPGRRRSKSRWRRSNTCTGTRQRHRAQAPGTHPCPRLAHAHKPTTRVPQQHRRAGCELGARSHASGVGCGRQVGSRERHSIGRCLAVGWLPRGVRSAPLRCAVHTRSTRGEACTGASVPTGTMASTVRADAPVVPADDALAAAAPAPAAGDAKAKAKGKGKRAALGDVTNDNGRQGRRTGGKKGSKKASATATASANASSFSSVCCVL